MLCEKVQRYSCCDCNLPRVKLALHSTSLKYAQGRTCFEFYTVMFGEFYHVVFYLVCILHTRIKEYKPRGRGGGGGTSLYKPYRHVWPQIVWFSSRFGVKCGYGLCTSVGGQQLLEESISIVVVMQPLRSPI